MITTDTEIGRQPGESDASFFLKILTLAHVEKDREKRKYMAKRLKELQKIAVEEPLATFTFPDRSKIAMTIERKLNEDTDEIDDVVKFNVVGSEADKK